MTVKTANEFRSTDFGKRCEEWLLRSLEDEGPILFSTLGQGHFLPQGIEVRDWLLSIPGVVPYLGLGPNNYCESSERPSDSREKRRSPVIIPDWMKDKNKKGLFLSDGEGVGGIRPLGSFLRRIYHFFEKFLTHLPISKEKWNTVVRTLNADRRLTVFVRYRNGQESFMASKFLSGDGDVLLVRSCGGNIEVKRSEVAELRLMRVNRFQQIGIGRVKTWYMKDSQIGYGFIVDDNINEEFYFETRGIIDSRLEKSLSSGRYGQTVRYQIVKEKVGDKLAIVQVLELLKDYAGGRGADDQFYREGHRAMIQGDLKKAEDLLRQALAGPVTTRKISALKDLAETYNRQNKSGEAIKLIEEYRGSFSSDEWESFERMEIGYLERLGKVEEALGKVKNLLKKARDMEPGQREHYEKKRDVLRQKLSSQNDRAMSGGGNADGLVDAEKLAREEDTAEMLRKIRFDEVTLRQLADFAIESNQHDKIVLSKIEDFRRTSGWTSRSRISKMVRIELESTSFPDKIANAIEDVLDLELIRQASERPELELVKPEKINACEGVNTYGLAIRLCRQSDIPLKNVRITLDHDHGVEEAMCANISYEDGLKPISIRLKVLPREVQAGRGSIRYKISYEKDLDYDKELDNDILAKMDEDAKKGHIEGRFEFYLGENGFSPIEPNPYEKFCNHDARGEFFVGREKRLAAIAENLSSRDGGQSYFLYGQPKMGKTSIRKNLHGKLAEKLNDSLLYTSLSIKDWGRGEAGDRKKREPLKWLTFDIVMDVIEGYLRPQGKWTADMERVFDKIEDEATDYYATKLKYIGRILRNMGVVWVVVIDEFTDLYDLLQRCDYDEVVFGNMLGLMDVLKTRLEDGSFNLLLIGLESMPQFIKEMRNPSHVIKEEPLECLSKKATANLLVKPLAGRLFLEEDSLDQYCLLTGGFPLYAMYFCREVVSYANEHGFSIIKIEDVDAIADSICKGPRRWRPDEFDPFFQIGIREYNGHPLDERVLAELYYEVAGNGNEDSACPLDVFNNRDSHKAMFDFLLKERDVFVQNPNGTVKFKVGIFAKYLQLNPNLSSADFRKQL